MIKDFDANADIEVSVKDIVNFYVKINDSSKAKKDIAQLSSKDKAAALEIIATSSATRDFRIDVARHFLYDLDAVVRRKAERFMEDLVPDWVSNPAESILRLLKSTEGKDAANRNAAVKFLFGIVDSGSLRDTFSALFNGRNRDHMSNILATVEDYIESSNDERELVKIFDACIDIVVSDVDDHNVKHHASNLLSVFFKKVQATSLGDALRRKYVERQVDKAEGVYHFLCSGAFGLNNSFLDDLLRPLVDGGSKYQLKILTYFKTVLEKAKTPDEIDSVLDTYPDYWNQEEPAKEDKIRVICGRILRAVDELWDATDDRQVHALIIRIRYGEYGNKRELLEQIRLKADDATLNEGAKEKLALMLGCFLSSELPDPLKLQASQMLLFKVGDPQSRLAALEYITGYLENKNLNYAELGSIATVIEQLLAEKNLSKPVRDVSRYLLFIADAERVKDEQEQKELLEYLLGIAEGEGFAGEHREKRVLDALSNLVAKTGADDMVKKKALYLQFKIKNPGNPLTWDAVSAGADIPG